MPTKISVEPGGLSFVDSSLTFQFIIDHFDQLVDLYGYYSVLKAILNIINRRPLVEYALGFDGVDDYIEVPGLVIGESGLNLESEIWISKENKDSRVVTLIDDENSTVFTLAYTDTEPHFKAYYSEEESMEKAVIQNIDIEKWQDLRIWSDGREISVSVDDKIVSSGNIDFDNPPYRLYFGSSQSFNNLEGMIRSAQVSSAVDEIFSIESGDSINFKDETNSAVISGLHNIKKGRFEEEFN